MGESSFENVALLTSWILTSPKLVTESKSKPLPLGTVGHYCKVQNPSIHTYVSPKCYPNLYILSSSHLKLFLLLLYILNNVETLQRRLFRGLQKTSRKMLLEPKYFCEAHHGDMNDCAND